MKLYTLEERKPHHNEDVIIFFVVEFRNNIKKEIVIETGKYFYPSSYKPNVYKNDYLQYLLFTTSVNFHHYDIEREIVYKEMMGYCPLSEFEKFIPNSTKTY